MVRICVFASSSSKTSTKLINLSRKIGQMIAKGGHICVNGGGNYGCMGALNEGCKEFDGKSLGIIHEMFITGRQDDAEIKKMMIARGNDLSERKTLLFENADCFIVLPGGVGTYDELWDAVCQRSLHMSKVHNKPICLLNYDNFYDGFIMQLNRAKEEGLLYGSTESYFRIETEPSKALEWCISNINPSSHRNEIQPVTDELKSLHQHSKRSMQTFSTENLLKFVGGFSIGFLTLFLLQFIVQKVLLSDVLNNFFV